MADILLIEPDRILARTYILALELNGHVVNTCTSAQSAIRYADRARPNIVILELQMVGHSGIEFLYEFRSYTDWQQIPVIALTCVPASEFASSWRLLRDELGVRTYHYKPQTSLRKLVRSVNELVATQ
jgi:DNA-binding response OmpR family regulator